MVDFLAPGRARRPSVTTVVMETILSSSYGLRMLSCKELDSYDDFNFLINAESLGTNRNLQEICNHGYVMKILNSLDSKNTKVLDAQHEMMSRVFDGGVPTPRAVPTLTGETYLEKELTAENAENSALTDVGNTYVVRLFNFVPGAILGSVPLTEGLCYKVGVMAGRVDTALKGFQHSGFQSYQRKWHLDSIPRLHQVLHVIQDGDDRSLVSDVFKTFKSSVLDHLEDLTQGVIHADFNEENILVTKRMNQDRWNDEYDVAAILDYGDSLIAPYIFEVAIAMAYMTMYSDKLSVQTASGYVMAGYLSAMTLSEKEISLLKLCMCARMAQSLVIGAYSVYVDPSNDYTLKTAAKGWPRLRQLWNSETGQIVKEWKEITAKCNMGIHKSS